MKKRRKSATFHVDEDFSAGWRKRNARRMGFGRAVFSALSISLGLGSAYMAMHYIPAYMSPSQVIRVSDIDEQSISRKNDGVAAILAPYWRSLQSRRSYIWSGESLEVQYQLDAGQSLDLVIERCARKIVIEMFNCEVVSQQTVRVDGRNGVHRLRFKEPGFYHFRERQIGASSRVIWRRV